MVPYPPEVSQLLRRAYYASVSFTDNNIGQLLGSLKTSGAEKNTVVSASPMWMHISKAHLRDLYSKRYLSVNVAWSR